MALGYYFAPPAMSVDQYRECIKRLTKAGAGHPSGRTYHSAFGPPEKVMVFDVWTSQAAFDKFGKTLMPILQEMGLDAGQPSIMEVHNEIRPPKKAAAAGGKKRAKAKPARGKARRRR